MNNAGLKQLTADAEQADKATTTASIADDAVSSDESCVAITPISNLDDSSLYIHRELSQLQFNIRVLEQALDDATPPPRAPQVSTDFLQQP